MFPSNSIETLMCSCFKQKLDNLNTSSNTIEGSIEYWILNTDRCLHSNCVWDRCICVWDRYICVWDRCICVRDRYICVYCEVVWSRFILVKFRVKFSPLLQVKLYKFVLDKWGRSWLYGSWIYNYLCNQCLSPLTLWVWISLMWGVLHTTLCDKVCQWLPTGRWFSSGTPVSSTNKNDCHDITEILLKVALNIIPLTLNDINKVYNQVKVNFSCNLTIMLIS